MEKWVLSYCHKDYLSTLEMLKRITFTQVLWKKNGWCIYTQLIYPHSTGSVENLQTGIDIGGDVPDMIFQLLIAFLQR